MGKRDLEMTKLREVSRILYANKSRDSKQAEQVLKSNRIAFARCASSKDTIPPTLVTSEGEFPGVENISWYAIHFANGKWETDLE
jgi:hypothetical protein